MDSMPRVTPHGGPEVTAAFASSSARLRHRVYSIRRFFVFRVKLAGPPAADHVGHVVFRRATQQDLENLDSLEAHGRGAIQRLYVNGTQVSSAVGTEEAGPLVAVGDGNERRQPPACQRQVTETI